MEINARNISVKGFHGKTKERIKEALYPFYEVKKYEIFTPRNEVSRESIILVMSILEIPNYRIKATIGILPRYDRFYIVAL